VGLVGVGGIGQTHLERWRALETEGLGVRVAAVCDVDRDRAEATGLPAFTSVEGLLAGADLDAVDICTPPKFHAPVALAALAAGLPTLCEKPLATTIADARALRDAAEQAGKPLQVGFCHRFHDPIVHVKERLASGEWGRPLMFRNRFGTLFAGVEDTWFSNREMAGGGALMDTSVHSIDLFRCLMGEVTEASAMLATFDSAIQDVEDSATLLLRAHNGALGVVEASWRTPFSVNVVEIYAERAAAIVDYDAGTLKTRRLGETDWQAETLPGRDRFREELRHFAAVVRGEEAPRADAEDGLRAVEIILTAYGEGHSN